MDLTKKLPWNVCILRPAGEREIKIGSVHGQFILSIGKRLTFSTSDSHDSLKPNITSEISPEENNKLYLHCTIDCRSSCDVSCDRTHLKAEVLFKFQSCPFSLMAELRMVGHLPC